MITKITKNIPKLIRNFSKNVKAELDFQDTGKLGDFLYYGHTLDNFIKFAFVETTNSLKHFSVFFLIV